MRWFKFLIALAVGVFLQLIVAAVSCKVVNMNQEWISLLKLPYFAPHGSGLYYLLMTLCYLCTSLAFGFYTETVRDVKSGLIMICVLSATQIATLIALFTLTYEISCFLIATLTLVVCFWVTMRFLQKNTAAGACMLPVFTVCVYLWAVIYCILTINFT